MRNEEAASIAIASSGYSPISFLSLFVSGSVVEPVDLFAGIGSSYGAIADLAIIQPM